MAEVELRLPKLAMTMQEATVAEWLVAEGDRIEQSQDIVAISTDKVDANVPAPAAGVVARIAVPAGETVPVGTLLAVIDA